MKVAAYCRVSTGREEQLSSLKNQKIFFEEYAKKEGFDLVKIYADEGISGTSLKKRTEFQKLMNDAEQHLFNMVIVKDISRFSRNTVDLLQSVRKLKSLGINTYFINSNMETMGESEFILTIYGALAQQESCNLSSRIKFGKQISAQKGRAPQRIFGYTHVDTYTLDVDAKEAAIVREIFRLYNENGLGCHAISTELNRQGHLTKLNCQWTSKSVLRILTNSIYCGEYENNKYEVTDCIEGKTIKLPKEKHLYHNRPEWAIISKDAFYKAQKIMEDRKQKNTDSTQRNRYSGKHSLSTLIKCEHCGHSFSRKIKNGHKYWKCPTNDQYTKTACDNNVTIKEEELLSVISDYLKEHINCSQDEFIQSISDEISEISTQKSAHTPTNQEGKRKIKNLEAKIVKYKEMYALDLLSLSELEEKIHHCNQEIQQINNILKNASYSFDESKITKIAKEFLGLKNVSNVDLRYIIDLITINKNRQITIKIKDLFDGKSRSR